MYGLSLEWTRCPDGVETHDFGPVDHPELLHIPQGRLFRYRSERRDRVRYDISNLDRPIAVRFVNARDEKALKEFFGRFGLPIDDEWTAPGLPARIVDTMQDALRSILELAGGADRQFALGAVNDFLAGNLPAFRGSWFLAVNLTPTLDLADNRSVPRLALRPRSLMQLMMMEVAMMAENDCRFARCDHCADAFLTGSLTGRRSHARFCSDKCRVAAMRVRNANRATE